MSVSHQTSSSLTAARQFVFVLVAPSHPGNIGAAARAIKTMGFNHLRLVRPARFPSTAATAMATTAADVLAAATVFPSLAEAVADCELVLGTSARARHYDWPCISAKQAALKAQQLPPDYSVAFVFGCEQCGLSNEELLLCHERVYIDSSAACQSLNLAAAVQIISYELFCHLQEGAGHPLPDHKPVAAMDRAADSQQCERFFQHLQQVLSYSGFLSAQRNQKSLMTRLRLLFNRARMTRREVNILRGVLSTWERCYTERTHQ